MSNLDKKSARRLALFKKMGFFGPNTLGYEITRATTLDDLVAAYSLVHDCFVEEGFILPHPSGIHLTGHEAISENATFVAKLNSQVIGVLSVVADLDDLGLRADGAFRREIDVLRNQGRYVCEGTNLAIAPNYRRTSVTVELLRTVYAQGIQVHHKMACTDYLGAVSPNHMQFFELIGYKCISPIRSYSTTVYDPVILMRLDCQLWQRECNDPINDDDDHLCFLANYVYNNNPYCEKIAGWQVAADQMFRDVNLLKELFVTRSGLLAQCNEQAREAIRKRWGDEIFAAVYQK